jgi:hypothetical protein
MAEVASSCDPPGFELRRSARGIVHSGMLEAKLMEMFDSRYG